MDIVIAIVVGLVTGIAVMEGYAWADAFAAWLLKRSVRHIIVDERARYEEEWSADLRAMPNSLLKIAYALTNFRKATAHRINAEFMTEVLEQLDGMISNYAGTFQRLQTKLEYIESRIGRGIPRRGHEEQYQEIVEEFAKVKQCHQRMGFMVEALTKFHSEVSQEAAQANTTAAADAWSMRLEGSMDMLIIMLKHESPISGFTHVEGDLVTVATSKLGRVTNRMRLSEAWEFSLAALTRRVQDNSK